MDPILLVAAFTKYTAVRQKARESKCVAMAVKILKSFFVCTVVSLALLRATEGKLQA